VGSIGSRSPALRILRLCLTHQRGLAVALVICVVVAGLIPPAFTVATGALIDAVAGGGGWLALAVVSALYLAQHVLAPIQQEIGTALARRVDASLTEQLMGVLARPPGLVHLEDPAMQDAIARAQGTLVGVTPGGAAPHVARVWMQRCQGIASLAIVGTWRWWAALALVPVYALAFAASRWHWHQVTQVIHGRVDELRRAYYLRKLALSAEIAKETRVFGLASWLVDRYRSAWTAVMDDVWRKRSEGWLAAVVIYGAMAAAEAAILIGVARQAASGELTVGRAVIIAGAVVAAGALGMFHDGHWYLGEAARALAQLADLQRAELGGVRGGTAPAGDLPRHAIRFEAVRFGYAGRDARVFDGLDLTIEAGRSLAIVGENGAGKTTLVKLLARLYDPDHGRITVDGIDLRELAPHAWHRRIAAIFQDFTQFELSAEDNVAFGALDRRADRAAVERAAQQAGAGPVVGRLARGWQTPLSRQFSAGTQLSGGEWQRLALARALFAVQAGAGVLVLDEPTASLDVRGEAEVYERFLELTRGVTTIVISHRFSTVRRADRIVVLEHGSVVEDGSHDALIAAGGRYATMYALQAARFAPEAGDA